MIGGSDDKFKSHDNSQWENKVGLFPMAWKIQMTNQFCQNVQFTIEHALPWT